MATDRCSTCAYCSPREAKLGCHAVSTYAHPDSCRVRDWRPEVLWMQRMWWNMLEPIPNLSFNLWARLQLCWWHRGARGKMHPSRWVPWWALSTDTRLQSDRSEVLYSHNFSFSCQWNIWLSFRVRGIIFSIWFGPCRMSNWRPDLQGVQRMRWNVCGSKSTLSFNLCTWLQLWQ